MVGDALYGGRTDVLERQFLHAHLLGFEHPRTGEWVEFRSSPPEDLWRALKLLEKMEGGQVSNLPRLGRRVIFREIQR